MCQKTKSERIVMTTERVSELERIASDAIEEARLLGAKADNASLAYWRGVKTVVDELKMTVEMPSKHNK